jgi:hypothetical protein
MATGTVSMNSGALGALFRILCGCLTLGLSLVCVFASFRSATTMTGQDALTMWIFFLWGLGLAWGGVWLIRGRSKGKAIVFARDRKRLVAVALLAILVVGLLIFLMSQPSLTDDAVWWPLMLQTMFANLFASLPFALFDREDYKERREPAQLDTAGRRKIRQRTILVVVVGGLMLTAGLTVGQQMDPWWEDVLVRLGVGLLACAAVLGYKLRKSSRPASGTDST